MDLQTLSVGGEAAAAAHAALSSWRAKSGPKPQGLLALGVFTVQRNVLPERSVVLQISGNQIQFPCEFVPRLMRFPQEPPTK